VRKLIERSRYEVKSGDLRLTGREQEVLALLADGLSPAKVSTELVISQSTVGTHIEHIYEKLGARTRAHAVGIAFRNGLLDAGERTA
jgi:DNA-binding CsgD family transcriptional regulator